MFAEAATEDDRNVGIQMAQFEEGFFAIHMWHRQVEQNADNLFGMSAKYFESFAPVRRRQYVKAQTFEHLLTHRADRLFIVSNQYGPAATP